MGHSMVALGDNGEERCLRRLLLEADSVLFELENDWDVEL